MIQEGTDSTTGETVTLAEHNEKTADALVELLDANLPEWNIELPGNRLSRRDFKGRQLPASSDPHIQERRLFAMRFWNEGFTSAEVMVEVNKWLAEKNRPPVSIGVIRLDHKGIFEEWEADFEHSSAELRIQHISTLNRMKKEALDAWQLIKGKPGAAAYIKAAAQIEEMLAILDGSKKRAEVKAESEALAEAGKSIKRVYEFRTVEHLPVIDVEAEEQVLLADDE